MFNAIVLAADRGRDDPVAVAAGVAAKCLTPIGGSPMVVRVVRALEQSERVNTHPALRPGRAKRCEASPELRAGWCRAARPLDEPAGHARHQRRRRAGRAARGPARCC